MFEKTIVRGLLALVGIILASDARAGIFTYNIADYPAYESDPSTGGTDTISGTIITDSNSGLLATANIMGGNFTIQNPTYGDVTVPISGNVTITGSVTATPDSLTLAIPSAGSVNEIEISAQISSAGVFSDGFLVMEYRRTNYPSGTLTPYDIYQLTCSPVAGTQSIDFGALTIDPNRLSLGGVDQWLIATEVPEPSTLTLLIAGAVGLFGYAWRRADFP